MSRIASLSQPKAAPRPATLPPDDELARRGITFERVHAEYESPVRLRHNGHACGIFTLRRDAAQVIKTLAMLCLVALMLPSAHAMAPAEEAALIKAISTVESPHGAARGRAGELWASQILPATWRRHSSVPMETALPAEVARVERSILTEIRGELQRQGLPETAHNYALRWNAGARATRFTAATWDYARRVVAILEAGK